MWAQVAAIAWAQMRAARNHLPRTTFGSLLGFTIGLIWYGGFGAFAVFLATSLPFTPADVVQKWLASWLLGVFLFWQLVPLFTLSGGWSLDRNKLQIYPISDGTLLLTETALRISASLEMLLVLLGICIGLLQRRDLPPGAPLALLLFIPFNLLLALAVRDFALKVFRHRRLRELLTIALVTLAVVPQILLSSGAYPRVAPYFLAVANGAIAPWHNIAAVGLGAHAGWNLLLALAWIALAYIVARRQFVWSMREEEPIRTESVYSNTERGRFFSRGMEWLNQAFADPVGTLIVKELRSLLRMPRFRVVFALATFFAVLVLIPSLLRAGAKYGNASLPAMNLYGLLILGDSLMWNIFGFDRSAAQAYFAFPVDLRAVFRAKNLVAVFFMAIQTIAVIVFSSLLRLSISVSGILTALFAALVMGTCFLAVGNLSSVIIPRPSNPRSTMRNQAGGTVQLWLVGCSLGSVVLIGAAFLAGWGLGSAWATVAVLAIEFALALVMYRIATESAVSRGNAEREKILAALSKGSSIVSG